MVSSGGTVSSASSSGGVVVVSSGQSLVVSGGQTSSGITVLGGGNVFISSGGTTIADQLIGSGLGISAIETVSNGGVASGTILTDTGVLFVGRAALRPAPS